MSENINIFEQASRIQLRFASAKGQLTVEHLWALPLTSNTSLSLDGLAVAVNRELKAQGEESFVETKDNPYKRQLQLSLDILKHIIGVRQAENAAKLDERNRKAEIARIEEALTNKKDETLRGLSQTELEERLKVLKGT